MSFFDRFKSTPDTQLERSHTTIAPEVSNTFDMNSGYADRVDRLSIVYGCVNRRASTVAQLPLKLYRKTDIGREEAVDSIYYNILSKRPNGFQTPYQFWHWVVRQLDLYGNAYVKRIRNGLGQTIELLPVCPGVAQVGINKDTGLPTYNFDGKLFTADQIIHFKGYSSDGLTGLSAVELFRVMFDGYMVLESAGTDIAKNAAKAPNVINHPTNFKEDELKKLKAGWDSGFRGSNAGKTAWLPDSFKIAAVPNGMSATDIQYIEQKKFSAQRICSDIFGVPQHMLGLTSNPTYGSVEQMATEFIQYTIQPILVNIEQTINTALFPEENVYAKFNVGGLLRGDVNTRINAYKFAIEHGCLTPNQYHSLEDDGIVVPAEQGGDTYVKPLNFGPAAPTATVSGSV